MTNIHCTRNTNMELADYHVDRFVYVTSMWGSKCFHCERPKRASSPILLIYIRFGWNPAALDGHWPPETQPPGCSPTPTHPRPPTAPLAPHTAPQPLQVLLITYKVLNNLSPARSNPTATSDLLTLTSSCLSPNPSSASYRSVVQTWHISFCSSTF